MENVSLCLTADYNDGTGEHIVKYNGSDWINVSLTEGVDDYYITGLPKYTPTGELITYKVAEMAVNGTTFYNKKITMGTDTLTCDTQNLDYIVNPKSNSDDLIPIVITNSFTGRTDCTVNKVWKDDTSISMWTCGILRSTTFPPSSVKTASPTSSAV